MGEERKKILNMLAEGKIDVAEAERLLAAVGEAGAVAGMSAPVRKGARFLRIVVSDQDAESGSPDRINVRVPLGLIRSGIKIGALLPEGIPDKAKAKMMEKGINFEALTGGKKNIEDLIESLEDLTVDVEDETSRVRVFCE